MNVLASASAIVMVAVLAIVVQALRAPGSDSVEAKLAEWGRDHGLSREVTLLERIQYDQDPPAVGGTPPGGIGAPAGAVAQVRLSTVLDATPLAVLAPGPRLPNEGAWQTVVAVHGIVFFCFIRSVHSIPTGRSKSKFNGKCFHFFKSLMKFAPAGLHGVCVRAAPIIACLVAHLGRLGRVCLRIASRAGGTCGRALAQLVDHLLHVRRSGSHLTRAAVVSVRFVV